jgi:hypothetical protein
VPRRGADWGQSSEREKLYAKRHPHPRRWVGEAVEGDDGSTRCWVSRRNLR